MLPVTAVSTHKFLLHLKYILGFGQQLILGKGKVRFIPALQVLSALLVIPLCFQV